MEDFTAPATQALLGQGRIVLISTNVTYQDRATPTQPVQILLDHTTALAKQASREMEIHVPISTNA